MIELKGISFSYQNQDIENLCNVNLKIEKGECVLFCGRSGCGKSTIMRLLNGLIPRFYPGQLKGNVFLDGQNLVSIPMYQISEKVGSVFQNPRTQFFNVDTDSEIVFGLENKALEPKELHRRLNETIESMKIEHLKNRNIFELSGGEKQKIAFASIYAMNPEVYLLDEPSSNLDVNAICDLKEQLKALKEQGKTVLVADHRLYYLMDLADRVVFLSHGKIAEIYTPQSLMKLPAVVRENMGIRAVDMCSIRPCKKRRNVNPVVLEIKDVTLYYKKQILMKHIRLKAAKGEIIGIVGHNGAGKTTFLRTLCGLHKEHSGDFLWNGVKQSKKQRMRKSYLVMQDVNYELFADTVESECSHGIKNPDFNLIEQTLTELELTEFRNRHPNTLSGGQKQRVAVAVSMICGKELLVFDEPTSGLDLDNMKKIGKLIQKLSENKIIFVVTHDYEFVCQTCTRLVCFDHGTITDDLSLSEDNKPKICDIFGLK